MNLHSDSSGPEILLLLLKAPISISAPFSPSDYTAGWPDLESVAKDVDAVSSKHNVLLECQNTI